VDTPIASRLIKADGSRTGDKRETLETLMLIHFSENRIVWDTNVASEDILKTMDGSKDEAWRKSWTCSRVKR
jgi:hypothetical protein